ncbi:MAG: hypothetical protein QOF70_4938 [Acetobacteraceae bacterium]|nr:hypothetical protein [Acetobacteraceae bacterium]
MGRGNDGRSGSFMGVNERFPHVSPKVVRLAAQPLRHAGRFTRRGRLVQRAPCWCLFCGNVRQFGLAFASWRRRMNHFEIARKAEAGEIAAAAALLPEPRVTGRADPDHVDPAICKNCIHPSNAGLGDQSQIFAVQASGLETWVGIVAGGEPPTLSCRLRRSPRSCGSFAAPSIGRPSPLWNTEGPSRRRRMPEGRQKWPVAASRLD